MEKRYALSDCYTLLQVDPKTFRRWIEKAGIVPQASKADDRVKYLTHDQLVTLAELHERTLPETLPHQEATITPATYKLVLDQIGEVQQAQKEQATLLQAVLENDVQLTEQVTTSYQDQELLKTSIGTLRTLTDHKLTEMADSITEQRRQHDNLSQTITHQREIYEAAQEKINYLAGQIVQILEAQRAATQKIEQLEETLHQEREAREILTAQVATLQQKRQRPQPKKAVSPVKKSIQAVDAGEREV